MEFSLAKLYVYGKNVVGVCIIIKKYYLKKKS